MIAKVGICLIFGALLAPELCLAQDNGTFSCTGKPNGFYADPENCRYYFECEPNGMFHFLCENDWLYDEGTTYCDYQDRVECGSRPLCDSDGNNCQEHHVTTPGPPLEECDITCPDDGFYEYESCSSFYCHCSVGHPYLEECADGLVFNPDLGGCDWPYNNPDCGS